MPEKQEKSLTKLRLCKKRVVPAITENQQNTMTALGKDLKTLLDARQLSRHWRTFCSDEDKIIWSLQKIKTGILTGPSVTLGTIHLIAEKLGAEVAVSAPNEEWNSQRRRCARCGRWTPRSGLSHVQCAIDLTQPTLFQRRLFLIDISDK